MAIEVWNELGESVEDERGELVCVKPFPCMPTHFWDDDQGFKYKKGTQEGSFRRNPSPFWVGFGYVLTVGTVSPTWQTNQKEVGLVRLHRNDVYDLYYFVAEPYGKGRLVDTPDVGL